MVRSSGLKLGLGSLLLCAGIVGGATLAAAGEGTGHWRNGMVEGPYGPGYYDGWRHQPRVYGDYGGGYGGDCYVVRRRYVDDWGRVVIRRHRVCQ